MKNLYLFGDSGVMIMNELVFGVSIFFLCNCMFLNLVVFLLVFLILILKCWLVGILMWVGVSLLFVILSLNVGRLVVCVVLVSYSVVVVVMIFWGIFILGFLC